MKVTNFLSIRFLFSKKRHKLISFITLISVAGVSVGVFGLIVVLSVMNGFESDLTEKIMGTRSHITINSLTGRGIRNYTELIEQLKNIKGVKGVAPISSAEIMIRSEGSVQGGVIFGIDPELEVSVTDLKKYMLVGDLQSLDPDLNEIKNTILIGSELASEIDVTLNDRINIIAPIFRTLPNGIQLPKAMTFKVVGIFKTGMYDYDRTFCYVSNQNFRKLFRIDDDLVTGIHLKVENPHRTREISQLIQRDVAGAYFTRDWIDMNRNLFTALKMEKIVMYIILFAIVLVASINIISALIMVVMEKRKDIGILKAIGFGSSKIIKIFLNQGMIIAISGIIIGTIAGVIVCFFIAKMEIGMPGGGSVYYIDTIPVEFRLFPDYFFVVTGTLIIAFLCSLLPSYQASVTKPIEVIRYE